MSIAEERLGLLLLTGCGVCANDISPDRMRLRRGRQADAGREERGKAKVELGEWDARSRLCCLVFGKKRKRRECRRKRRRRRRRWRRRRKVGMEEISPAPSSSGQYLVRCSKCRCGSLAEKCGGRDSPTELPVNDRLRANPSFMRRSRLMKRKMAVADCGCFYDLPPTTTASVPSVVASKIPTKKCTKTPPSASKSPRRNVQNNVPNRQRRHVKDTSGSYRVSPGGVGGARMIGGSVGGGGVTCGGGGGVGGGGQLGIAVTVLALVVSSCHGFPTRSTHPHPTNSQTEITSHYPPRRDWSLCCGGGSGAGNTGGGGGGGGGLGGPNGAPKLTGVQSGNVTVIRTSATSVCVTWSRHGHGGKSFKYEVTYKPINAKYRVVAEVTSPHRSLVLERLLPLTQYQLQVTTFLNDTILWSSPVVTFHTTRDDIITENGTGILISTPPVLDADVSIGSPNGSTSPIQQEGHVRVRAEEVGIVLLVLAVWMFAIALFFNRWGKIRMLEPYQEPYKEAPPMQHRPSCPMADPCSLPINPLKFEHNGSRRPRQNSVFVGRTRSHSLEVHPPRRVKSALNLTTLVLQESEEESGIATTFT
ncbi:uncharacterized protein [Macrobrachium rosenbergii]|uniref:uncharacterized protein isoform X2 n=1 Tax=Macrobrachium rosenbergii TaxID=79674 RepID=UPI0034D3EAC3